MWLQVYARILELLKSESESCSVVSSTLQPHGLYSLQNSLGQNTGVGSLSLLQGICWTQEPNQGLLHCRRILYQLSYQRSPRFTQRTELGLIPEFLIQHTSRIIDLQEIRDNIKNLLGKKNVPLLEVHSKSFQSILQSLITSRIKSFISSTYQLFELEQKIYDLSLSVLIRVVGKKMLSYHSFMRVK